MKHKVESHKVYARKNTIESLLLYYEKINLFLNSKLFCIVQDQNRREALRVFFSLLFFCGFQHNEKMNFSLSFLKGC